MGAVDAQAKETITGPETSTRRKRGFRATAQPDAGPNLHDEQDAPRVSEPLRAIARRQRAARWVGIDAEIRIGEDNLRSPHQEASCGIDSAVRPGSHWTRRLTDPVPEKGS